MKKMAGIKNEIKDSVREEEEEDDDKKKKKKAKKKKTGV